MLDNRRQAISQKLRRFEQDFDGFIDKDILRFLDQLFEKKDYLSFMDFLQRDAP